MSYAGKGSRERPARGIAVSNLRCRRFLFLLAAGLFVSPILAGEVRIEPTVDVVPANHLKFYLHFPEPMERGDVFRYLRLVRIDGDGNEVAEVPEPFREVELWDESFTRMTLWFHPGRQKPGVNLNVEIGPILEEGKRYRLEVSDDWRTEAGQELDGPTSHVFTAGPLDNEQPDPKNWKLGYAKGSLGKFNASISIGEPLDPESVRKRVRILLDGEEVDYRYSEDALYFDPASKDSGRVVVRIDPRVEDLAGNSVVRPFNLDLEKNPELKEKTDSIELSFQLPKTFP